MIIIQNENIKINKINNNSNNGDKYDISISLNNNINDNSDKNKANYLSNNNINEITNTDNIINQDNKGEVQKYSYECTNILHLASYIYEGTEESNIEIDLKNNGEYSWPLNSIQLICDKEASFKGKEIRINPQKPGEKRKYNIILTNFGKLSIGEYKSSFTLYINGKQVGEKLTLRIKVIENNSLKNEIEQNMEKINEFRDLSEVDYSDERILKY